MLELLNKGANARMWIRRELEERWDREAEYMEATAGSAIALHRKINDRDGTWIEMQGWNMEGIGESESEDVVNPARSMSMVGEGVGDGS
jgi:hypothetical protein